MNLAVELHFDATNESPSHTLSESGMVDAAYLACRRAKLMSTESCELQVGEGGPDDLFEVWPELGHGTVVVRIDEEEDDHE